jgi:hypothetical protein
LNVGTTSSGDLSTSLASCILDDYYVSSSGTSTTFPCASSTSACTTLNQVFSNTTSGTINIVDSTFQSTPVVVGTSSSEDDVWIFKITGTQKTLSVVGGTGGTAGFTVNNVILTFSDITLQHNSASSGDFILLLSPIGVIRLVDVTVTKGSGGNPTSNFFVGEVGTFNATRLTINGLNFSGAAASFIQIGSADHMVDGGVTVLILDSKIDNFGSQGAKASLISDNITANFTNTSVLIKNSSFSNISENSQPPYEIGLLIHLCASENSSLVLRQVNITNATFSNNYNRAGFFVVYKIRNIYFFIVNCLIFIYFIYFYELCSCLCESRQFCEFYGGSIRFGWKQSKSWE